MRPSQRRASAVIAVVGMLLAGCGDTDTQDPDDQAATQPPDGETSTTDGTDDGLAADPNEDVVDGVYRGRGVVLPVPEGWSLDPAALAQGTVTAVSEDGNQQMTAQAIDTDEAERAGQPPLEFEEVLDSVRQQAGRESDVDEQVELEGAERAQQLTYLDLPSPQEGMPGLSITIVVADDGQGQLAQFIYSAADENYDQDTQALLLEQAGFDPDSEPPAIPQGPQPAPSPTS